jgi:hypothetical protein
MSNISTTDNHIQREAQDSTGTYSPQSPPGGGALALVDNNNTRHKVPLSTIAHHKTPPKQSNRNTPKYNNSIRRTIHNKGKSTRRRTPTPQALTPLGVCFFIFTPSIFSQSFCSPPCGQEAYPCFCSLSRTLWISSSSFSFPLQSL